MKKNNSAGPLTPENLETVLKTLASLQESGISTTDSHYQKLVNVLRQCVNQQIQKKGRKQFYCFFDLIINAINYYPFNN